MAVADGQHEQEDTDFVYDDDDEDDEEYGGYEQDGTVGVGMLWREPIEGKPARRRLERPPNPDRAPTEP